jgi:hypothetical protein
MPGAMFNLQTRPEKRQKDKKPSPKWERVFCAIENVGI